MGLDPGGDEPLTRHVGNRLGIPEYAMARAHVASLRSEDPYRKVGAAALDGDLLNHALDEAAQVAAFHLPAAGAGNFGEFTPALLGKAGILKKHLVRRLG